MRKDTSLHPGHDIPCWTRLSGSDVYARACEIQSRRKETSFRNWQLTCRYYSNAQYVMGYEYGRALDLAILSWGSITCIEDDRANQAVSWVAGHVGEDDPDLPETSRLLTSCAEMDFSGDPRLIFVTLADLSDLEVSQQNLQLIKQESEARYRMDAITFYTSFSDFLSRVKANVQAASESGLSKTESHMRHEILNGIKDLQSHIWYVSPKEDN